MKINLLGRQMEIKTEVAVISAAILILLGCLAGYLFFRDDSDIIVENNTAADISTISGGSTSEAVLKSGKNESVAMSAAVTATGTAIAAKELIKVYVVGCVKKPGIVTLEKGQLIDDAVREAGGLTGEADADSINMVYALSENTMLYIKSREEIAQKQDPTTKVTSGKEQQGGGSLGKGALLVTDGGGGVDIIRNNAGNNVNNGNGEGKTSININTADAAELDKLPGIGAATARDIIAFREKNGPFMKIEDIMKVPRIKQNRFESIKDLISVN